MKGHRVPFDLLPVDTEHFELCNVYRESTAFVKILAPLYRHQSISYVAISTILFLSCNRNRLIWISRSNRYSQNSGVRFLVDLIVVATFLAAYTLSPLFHVVLSHTVAQCSGSVNNSHTVVHAQHRTRNENSRIFTRSLAQSMRSRESIQHTHLVGCVRLLVASIQRSR